MSEPATATAGSEPPRDGWQGRDRVAKSLKWFIASAPLIVAAATSLGLTVVLPAASSWQWTIVRVVVIAALSMTAITVDRHRSARHHDAGTRRQRALAHCICPRRGRW